MNITEFSSNALFPCCYEPQSGEWSRTRRHAVHELFHDVFSFSVFSVFSGYQDFTGNTEISGKIVIRGSDVILREYPHAAARTENGDKRVLLKSAKMPGERSRSDAGTGGKNSTGDARFFFDETENFFGGGIFAQDHAGSGSPILLDFGARNPVAKNNVVVWSAWDDATDRDTIKLAVFQ